MAFRFFPRSLKDVPPSAILLPLFTLSVIAAIIFWGDFIPVKDWLRPHLKSPATKSGVPPPKERTSRIRGVVQQGQTLSIILQGFQLTPAQAGLVLEAARPHADLNRLQPGNEYYATTGAHGELRLFEYYTDVGHLLKVTENNGAFTAELLAVPFEIKSAVRSGEVASTLSDSLTAAGVDAKTAREFTGIFAGDVDFAADIARGATWRMLYEEKWRDGTMHEAGRILAAEIVNKGRKYAAIYFEGASGKGDYYTPAGETVRRLFLKSPVRNRKGVAVNEPVQVKGQKKAQPRPRAAEFIAPAGTPVEALADGQVISTGAVKGREKTVELRHRGGFVTRYAHLSGLARGIRKGVRVRQGAVIGYVGTAGKKGRSYLEFAMQKGKRPVDPLNPPDLPSGKVAPKEMPRFRELVKERADLMGQAKALPPSR